MRISIFDFENYKAYIEAWIAQRPKSRGVLKEIAETAKVHSTLISQILKGDRHFSMEQSLLVSKFLQLDDLGQEYFMRLVEYEKAGSYELKNYVKHKITELKNKSMQLSERIQNKSVLSEADKKIYYSHWSYTALWVSFSLEKIGTFEEAAKFLEIPLSQVEKVGAFLLDRGLLTEKNGRLSNSTIVTHIGDDPLILSKHHGNWRQKAMELHPIMDKTNISYTAPLTISQEDFLKVREQIVEFINEIIGTVKMTKPEKVAFINIDWISL